MGKMETAETEIYHVALTSNEAYIKYVLVLLQSIFETNGDKSFCFYILYNQMEKETISEVTEYIKSKNAAVEFIYVEKDRYRKFLAGTRLTVETYFRLDVQDLLPDHIERLLFLDSDMIVCGDLKELYHTEFDNKYIAACGFSPRCERGSDFNAGMILFNMPKMRQDISFETYCKLADQLEGDYYFDQGLLNHEFSESGTQYVWKEKYNFTCSFYRKYKEEIRNIFPKFTFDDVVIMHFPGPGIRPWEMSISQEEYRQMKEEGILPFLASQNYIIDDVYVFFLNKWWEFARKTMCYEELLQGMYQKKSEIYANALVAAINSKDYGIGHRVMKLPRKIKRAIRH